MNDISVIEKLIFLGADTATLTDSVICGLIGTLSSIALCVLCSKYRGANFQLIICMGLKTRQDTR
jgi:hypothetical protein